MFRFVSHTKTRPTGLKWRSSVWFITLVVGLGVFTDSFFYMVIVPVIPFRLQGLGYRDPSSLTGWLLFAYSAGLVLSSPPIAWVSERFKARKRLLVIGIIFLIGAQIMFMFAPRYWVMVLARVIQGMSSTIVWTVGLALLSDTCPEQKVGQQMGLAMSGLSVGAVLAPPIGGSLYDRFGFHAPFIFSLGILVLDLVGRIMVIEKKQALQWDLDPAALYQQNPSYDGQAPVNTETSLKESTASESAEREGAVQHVPAEEQPYLSPLKVLWTLLRSRRTLTAIVNALFYAICYTSQEPTFPLRLQDIYGQSASHVGLLYLAVVVPTILSGFITGKLSDRIGTAFICTACFLFTIPWLLVMTIHGSLALIMVGAVFGLFFLSGALTPITSELAAVTRSMPGIGYTHVYGGFNMAFGIGSAVGPLIASQLYDHVRHGWTAVMILAAATAFGGACLCFLFMEEVPLLLRVMRLKKSRAVIQNEELS